VSEFEDDPEPGRAAMLPWVSALVLPFITAGVALVGGVAVGAVGMYVLRAPEIKVETKLREMTADELSKACAPMVTQVSTELDRANDEVSSLAESVKSKEAKVQQLEVEMKRRGAAGAALKRELEAAQADLASTKEQLQVAIAEQQRLVVELQGTREELDVQKVKTTEAKNESYDNNWQAFVNGAQLQVCEKGSRKKLGKCRESMVDALSPLRDTYVHCLRTGQATPTLDEAEKKQDELPQFAQWLDQDNKVLKGWFIQLCDPTLPEAKDYVPPPVDAPIIIPDLDELPEEEDR
jgi:hypothetical protein